MIRSKPPVWQSVVLLFATALFLFSPTAFADAPPAPRPTRLPTALPGGGMLPVWMTPPAPGPSQAEAGARLYYNRCMACHGDKQQGLTLEWRAQWDVEHQDCSRSACHGARHPPEGFSFPKNFAPPLVGPGTMAQFADAQGLFEFIQLRMPFQAPGTLTQEETWALVAFLLQQRGVPIARVDAANARAISLHVSTPPPAPGALAAGTGILLIAGVGCLLVRRFRKTV